MDCGAAAFKEQAAAALLHLHQHPQSALCALNLYT